MKPIFSSNASLMILLTVGIIGYCLPLSSLAQPPQPILSHWQIQHDCRNVTIKPNFNIRSLIGLWYEIYRFTSGPLTDTSMCNRDEYKLIDEMKMGVRIMGMSQKEITERTLNNTWTNLNGTAKPIAPNQPGFLVITLPGHPDWNLLVLDIGDRWKSIYSCEKEGNSIVEYAWIFSRDLTMPEKDKKSAFAAFTKFKMDASKFQVTKQGKDCDYTSHN